MSTPAYYNLVVFVKDYPEQNIKKGSIYHAFTVTNNPGTGMGSVGVDYGYKYWYEITGKYEKNIKFSLRNTNTIASIDRDSGFCEPIYDINKYFKEQRIKKLNKINEI